MNALDLVLSLALLGAGDSPCEPCLATEHFVACAPEAELQGYKDWWLLLFFRKDRHRNGSQPAEPKRPPGNTPTPGPLPLILLGAGLLGLGVATRLRPRHSERQKKG